MFFSFCLFFFIGSPQVFAEDAHEAESIITTVCSTCHKFEGREESRFNLRAPDLMWGGIKYQRDWLIRWLTGKEPLLYAKSYR
jgi:mono/diheme cytochrome c family protein